MRIVFMGTPEFAVPVLQALQESRHEVVGVFTQPDRPKGRGKQVTFPPVKEKALSLGIPVFQPDSLKDEGVFEQIASLSPDLIAVVAYGQFVGKKIRELPRFGCVNVHASLLPKYRGSAPIQWAVINGEEVSGVTTMYMSRTIDAGDMLLKAEVALDRKETGDSLHDKLMVLGGPLLLETIDLLEEGKAVRIPQDEEEATYAPMLEKTMGHLDFSLPAEELERRIRGLSSWPGAYTCLAGKKVKIWDSDVCADAEGEPGTVISAEKDRLVIAAGKGALLIREIQPEGKRRMSAEEYLRGYQVKPGDTAV